MNQRVLCAGLLLVVVGFLGGCRSREPFPYVKVSGRVSFDDGTPIPADTLRITFLPEAAPLNNATAPPAGTTIAAADGSFTSVTSHNPGDGIVAGKHKVTILALDAEQRPLASVPPEYMDPGRTPLEVDTAAQPFILLVKKAP